MILFYVVVVVDWIYLEIFPNRFFILSADLEFSNEFDKFKFPTFPLLEIELSILNNNYYVLNYSYFAYYYSNSYHLKDYSFAVNY